MQFRDEKGSHTSFYWHLLALKLGFVILFEVGHLYLKQTEMLINLVYGVREVFLDKLFLVHGISGRLRSTDNVNLPRNSIH